METSARRRIEAHEYRPPARDDVETIPAERLGVTNGLLLRFPRVHCVGDLSLLNTPGVAIVGARKASAEGRRRAAQLARDLARAGIVVVSGLAEGIDYAAHTAAIDHGGRTIAVIGTPLDKVYPEKHAPLQELIYREHLLVSAFQWGDTFTPSNFPERNRIMARLARATVIIEASDTSGSLHQADESVLVGRPVFVAREVVDDATLTWPRRILAQRSGCGRILTGSADVISILPAGGLRQGVDLASRVPHKATDSRCKPRS
jgi:DNA processing protein